MAIDLGDIPSGTEPTTAEKLQIRKAIGVGTTDAPTFLSVNVGSSTTSLSQLSIVGQAASNTLYLSAPNYIALNSDQISLMNGSVRSGLWSRTTGITVLSGHYFGFSSSATDAGFPAATILARDADGILAQRNGTAKQVHRVYNTFLGTTANEWGGFDWLTTTNTMRIGTEHGGTGQARPIDFVTGGTKRAGFTSGGNFDVIYNLSTAATFYFGASFNALTSPSAGVVKLSNLGETDFGRLQLGGTTSAFPAIAKSGNGIAIVAADNSQFASLASLYQRFGTGTPEGAVNAPPGAVFHRTDGGSGSSFYVKESGSGNTGWVAK